MYLWRRSASPRWWRNKESQLRAFAGNQLAIIDRSNRKRLQLEVASRSRTELQRLAKQFGGQIKKLPHDWPNCFLRRKTPALTVGRRQLIIPAGAAFGTGEHTTTAMSLQLLEDLTRDWKPGWSLVDLGTGSGILALAARRLGAKSVIGIDIEPMSISTAQENARLNNIDHVQFRLADVRRWKFPGNLDIVTANLFSELLIGVLPKLKRSRWLILSGVLRNQGAEVTSALKRERIDIVDLRRRGKWIAVLGRSPNRTCPRDLRA